MQGNLLVLADAPSLDYESLSTHLLRVSYSLYREHFTLIVDNSNIPLADMLDHYAQQERVTSIRRVTSLQDGLQIANTVLLFTTIDRDAVMRRCEAECLSNLEQPIPRDFQVCVVIQEDNPRG